MLLPRRLIALLALLALVALGSAAHALDAAGLAPALESVFPPSVAYLDCPFHGQARTCVLLPGAASVAAGVRMASAFLHSQPGVGRLQRDASAAELSFVVGATAYRLRVAASRARPGAIAATLSFTAEGGGGALTCPRRSTLFGFASLPSLTPGEYAAMATAIRCHGPDPVDARGRTPLFDAAAGNHLGALRTLLRAGADPNHIADNGWTPLLAAASGGSRPVLEALLRAGGDPTYMAPDGATLAALEPFNHRLGSPAAGSASDALLPPAELGEPAPAATGAAPAPLRPAQAAARPSGLLPLLLALAALMVAAVVTRLRGAAPAAPSPDPTLSAADWEPLATGRRRERRNHRLEPGAPWSDPLA